MKVAKRSTFSREIPKCRSSFGSPVFFESRAAMRFFFRKTLNRWGKSFLRTVQNPLITVSARWGDTAGGMSVVNFTKRNLLTGSCRFFASTPFLDNKSTDLRAKTVPEMECVSSSNPSLPVRRNRPILALWAPGRTHARTHERTDVRTHFRKEYVSNPPSTSHIHQKRSGRKRSRFLPWLHGVNSCCVLHR